MLQGDPGHRRFVVRKINAKKMGPRKTRGERDQFPPEAQPSSRTRARSAAGLATQQGG